MSILRARVPLFIVAVSMVSGCRERGHVTASLRPPPIAYVAGADTGQAAVVTIDGRATGYADVAFGVHRVGPDAVLYRRVQTVGGVRHATPSTEAYYVLQSADSSRLLARALPYFEDGFARPLVRGDTLFYWGIRRLLLVNGYPYAMRAVLSTGRVDSIPLPMPWAGLQSSQRPARPPVPSGTAGWLLFDFGAAKTPRIFVRDDFVRWQRAD